MWQVELEGVIERELIIKSFPLFSVKIFMNIF